MLTGLLASVPVALPATFTLATALAAQSAGAKGRAADPSLRRRRGGDDGRSMLGQDGHVDPERFAGRRGPAHARPTRERRARARRRRQLRGRAGPGRRGNSGRRRSRRAVRRAIRNCSLHAFDPATKMAEADVIDRGGSVARRQGRFPGRRRALVRARPSAALDAIDEPGPSRARGRCGPPRTMSRWSASSRLSDPPRADSAALIGELKGLGVMTVMVTGDAPGTAAEIARQVGLDGPICPPGRDPRPRPAIRLRGVRRSVSRGQVSAL